MLTGQADDTLSFTGNEFSLFINRHAGSLAIRSTKYEWTLEKGLIVFEGKGLGHGVGYASGDLSDLQRPDGIIKIS